MRHFEVDGEEVKVRAYNIREAIDVARALVPTINNANVKSVKEEEEGVFTIVFDTERPKVTY